MGFFSEFKSFAKVLHGLDKQVVTQMANQVFNIAAKKIADFHSGKKYKGNIINDKGEVVCEIIINPISDVYKAGLGSLIKEKLEIKSGKLTVEIISLPTEKEENE